MSPPAVPEKPVDIVPLPVIKALLKQCDDRDLIWVAGRIDARCA